jgi:putative redox protein
MYIVTVTSGPGLTNEVEYGEGRPFLIDEPAAVGGTGMGPDPYTLLLAALGGCTSMTIKLYAQRKGWPLNRVVVRLNQNRVHAKDCSDCASEIDGFIHRIEREIQLEGALTPEQEERLREIAAKCPVHKTLSGPIAIIDAPIPHKAQG